MKEMIRIKVDNIADFTVDGKWIPEGTKEAFGLLGTDKKESNERPCWGILVLEHVSIRERRRWLSGSLQLLVVTDILKHHDIGLREVKV